MDIKAEYDARATIRRCLTRTCCKAPETRPQARRQRKMLESSRAQTRRKIPKQTTESNDEVIKNLKAVKRSVTQHTKRKPIDDEESSGLVFTKTNSEASPRKVISSNPMNRSHLALTRQTKKACRWQQCKCRTLSILRSKRKTTVLASIIVIMLYPPSVRSSNKVSVSLTLVLFNSIKSSQEIVGWLFEMRGLVYLFLDSSQNLLPRWASPRNNSHCWDRWHFAICSVQMVQMGALSRHIRYVPWWYNGPRPWPCTSYSYRTCDDPKEFMGKR